MINRSLWPKKEVEENNIGIPLPYGWHILRSFTCNVHGLWTKGKKNSKILFQEHDIGMILDTHP